MKSSGDQESFARHLLDRIKSEIGKKSIYTAPDELSGASIRKYALAIGDFNPLYSDRDFAKRHGLRDVMAPPTLVTDTWQYMNSDVDDKGGMVRIFEPNAPHDWELIGNAVRAGNDYEFFQPVHPDDVLTAHWETKDVFEKTGRSGYMIFQNIQVSVYNQRDELLCTNVNVQIHRPTFDFFERSDSNKSAELDLAVAPGVDSPSARASDSRPDSSPQAPERKTRYFEDIQVGEKIAPLFKRFDQLHMMIYGAATWDFIRVHYDADAVRAAGFKAPFVDGQMLGGILAQQVQDWAGPSAFLRRLSFRVKTMSYPGDSITCHGVVTNKSAEDGKYIVECDVWADNQRGEKVVQPAKVAMHFPLRDS